MTDRPAEPDRPRAGDANAPEVFARLRIDAERTPDGRAILYFSWPGREAGPAAEEPADV